MEDAAPVRVLDAVADLHEELEPLARAEPVARRSSRVIGSPSTNSMTRYGRPVSVAPPSMTRAIAGCSMSASAWRSASNRATK